MTTTQDWTGNGYQHTDHGATAEQGSQAVAPLPTRRRKPSTTLIDPEVDGLVAAACQDQVDLLKASTADENAIQKAGRLYVIAQLERAIERLRGER